MTESCVTSRKFFCHSHSHRIIVARSSNCQSPLSAQSCQLEWQNVNGEPIRATQNASQVSMHTFELVPNPSRSSQAATKWKNKEKEKNDFSQQLQLNTHNIKCTGYIILSYFVLDMHVYEQSPIAVLRISSSLRCAVCISAFKQTEDWKKEQLSLSQSWIIVFLT